MTNLTKYKDDLKSLLDTAKLIGEDFRYRSFSSEQLKKLDKDDLAIVKKLNNFFEIHYQGWYTEAIAVIKLLIPDRLAEFVDLYKGDGKRKDISATTYNIQDWLKGSRVAVNEYSWEKPFDDLAVVSMRFTNQYQILASAEKRFTSSLLDMKQLLQADFFDTEIEASKELSKKGFYRAAGVICGVIIEKHLSQVCDNHHVPITKKHPTISDFNDLLKSNNVIDIANWRFIQRLGDLRNLCGHNKDKEPTKDDVDELIEGTDKLIKTTY
jgi:hypothetical protein